MRLYSINEEVATNMAAPTHSDIQLHHKFNWPTFGFLWTLAAISLITIVPCSLTLSGGLPANLLAAVLFGLGHLPATLAAGLPLSGLVISRALVLNGLLGITAGWLYRSCGLGSAMLAHFSADILLHVVLPVLL
jgi:hypothetical protein